MPDTNKNNDPMTKALGMVIALGALAFGAAAAMMNSERTRQLRQDLETQINDLSGRLDRELAARRPEIEDAIQRGKHVAVGSLEKVKGAVEQGADKAQEYVQRASVKVSDTAVDMRDAAQNGANDAANTVESVSSDAKDAAGSAHDSFNASASSAGEEARIEAASEGAAFADAVGAAGGTVGSATTEGLTISDAGADTEYDGERNDQSNPQSSF